MATTRTIIFDFKTKGVNIADQMKQAESSADRVSQKMGAVGGSLSRNITLPILGAAGASVKLASDMSETINKVDVSFGKSAGAVKDWSKTSIEKMGLAQGTALDTAALFGDMGTGMGLSEEGAAGMATGLTQLSADLSSFKNVKQDVAKTALAGIFTGETESLKQLGIVMTEANLKQFALAQGITKPMDQMTEAEKVQLRYAYVMSKTTKAQGDFERTGGGAANQGRKFTEQVKQLGTQFGTLLLPFVTKVITKMNGLLTKWQELSPAAKKIIGAIIGIVAAIGPVLIIVAKVITIFNKLKAAFLIIKGAMAAFSASALLPFLPIIAAVVAVIAIIVLLIKHWDKVKEVVKIVADAIVGFFTGMWDKVKSIFSGIGEWIDNTMLAIKMRIHEKIEAIKSAFGTIKDAVIKAFTAARDVISNIFQAIGNIIKIPINFIITSINNILKAINKIKIPSWVPGIGGKSANFPMIPTLASGGIVNSATQAIIGEGSSPEAVVPLNKQSIGNFTAGLGLKSTPQNITVNIPQTKVAMVDLNGNMVGNILLPQITRKLKLGGALT